MVYPLHSLFIHVYNRERREGGREGGREGEREGEGGDIYMCI